MKKVQSDPYFPEWKDRALVIKFHCDNNKNRGNHGNTLNTPAYFLCACCLPYHSKSDVLSLTIYSFAPDKEILETVLHILGISSTSVPHLMTSHRAYFLSIRYYRNPASMETSLRIGPLFASNFVFSAE